jgi:CubicO group peptidase (beta-lactamase class C family)
MRYLARGAWLASALVIANGTTPVRAAAQQARLDSAVLALMQRDAVPGVALTVVRGDSLLILRGWGMARVRDSLPVDPERSIFRLASVAKLFVAVSALQAVSEGRLELTRDVNAFLNGWQIPPRDDGPITLHHLLTHSAGFDERVIGYAAQSRAGIQPLGDYLARNLPHRGWPAGAVTGYSNHGMALAAHLVASAAGVSFDRYVAERVFAPLGMSSTHYLAVPDSMEARRGSGHFCDAARCAEAPEVYSHPFPVGLAFSTAADMSRFLRALVGERSPRVLSPEGLATLLRLQFRHDSLVEGMAYGFFRQTWRGRRVLAHSGTVPGTNNLLLLVPDDRLGIYFVANGGRSRFGEALRDTLLTLLLDGQERTQASERPSPAERPGERADGRGGVAGSLPVSARHLESLAGPYQMTRYAHRTIERFPTLFATGMRVNATAEGRLVLPYPGGAKEFEPIDSLHFREVGGERVIAFRRDGTGRVTHLFAPVPVFGAELPGAFERLAWHDAPSFMNEYTSWLLLGAWIVLGLWPVAAGVAWVMARRRGVRLAPGPFGARWLGLGSAVAFNALWATFGFLFVARSVRMLSQSTGLVYGVDSQMAGLSRIPYVLAPLGAVIVASAVYGWKRGLWDLPRRMAYSLLAIAAVLVLAFLVRWNYLPPRL